MNNNTTEKLDSTFTNWCKDTGMDLDKIDNMDEKNMRIVEQQVDLPREIIVSTSTNIPPIISRGKSVTEGRKVENNVQVY